MKEPVMVTIYCIVVKNGEVLLTEDEGKPGWKLPGGEVEKGEMFLDAAVREIKEESGYDIEPGGITSIQEYIKKDGTHRLRIYLVASFKGGRERLMNGEVKQIKWFSRKKLVNLKGEDFYLEPYYLAVQEYLRGRKYPLSLIRRLTGVY